VEKMRKIVNLRGDVMGEIAESEIADLGDVNELMLDKYLQARLNWIDESMRKSHEEAKRLMLEWDRMMREEV
jgi:hypothetical protein